MFLTAEVIVRNMSVYRGFPLRCFIYTTVTAVPQLSTMSGMDLQFTFDVDTVHLLTLHSAQQCWILEALVYCPLFHNISKSLLRFTAAVITCSRCLYRSLYIVGPLLRRQSNNALWSRGSHLNSRSKMQPHASRKFEVQLAARHTFSRSQGGNIQNHNSTSCFVWAWNLVSDAKGRA
jgi:hypothetical protein